MKLRLLETLRCPVCHSSFRMEKPQIRQVEVSDKSLKPCQGLCPFLDIVGGPRDCSRCAAYDVLAATLSCTTCQESYVIQDGLPRCIPPRHCATAFGREQHDSATADGWGGGLTGATGSSREAPPRHRATAEGIGPSWFASMIGWAGCRPTRGVFLDATGSSGGDPQSLQKSAWLTTRTASSFGYLWSRSQKAHTHRSYHFDRMEQRLSLSPAQGLVLDGGCGDGIDLANQAHRPGVEIIGVELTETGCHASLKRLASTPNSHVAQADLCCLPFDDNTFDFVYSYGVLHHLSSPQEGLQELVRVLKGGGTIAVYLYEDFSDRSIGWRWLLLVANQLRKLTPHVPHWLLYKFCQLASPFVYLLFTVPYHILRRIRGCGSFALSFPFRHAKNPLSLAGDLYDRFSTPIEWRYSQAKAIALLESAGLKQVLSAKDRGWMVAGIKPLALEVKACEKS